jgi:hypothetical protein
LLIQGEKIGPKYGFIVAGDIKSLKNIKIDENVAFPWQQWLGEHITMVRYTSSAYFMVVIEETLPQNTGEKWLPSQSKRCCL